MLRGLWQQTWHDIKIFVLEPQRDIGTVAIPVVVFVALGRMFSGRIQSAPGDP
jgi:hypothetical protein